MEDYDSLKVGAIFICIVEVAIFGMMPVYCPKLRKGTILGLLNSFTGGVLLAIGLMHLLHEAVIRFEKYSDIEYPMAFFLSVLSFSILLAIHNAYGSEHEKEEIKHEHRRLESNLETQGLEIQENKSLNENQAQGETKIENNIQNGKEKQYENGQSQQENQIVEVQQIKLQDVQGKKSEDNILNPTSAADSLNLYYENKKEVKATMIGIILMCILTIYGVLFGIIVGLQDSYSDTAILIIGLCGHKWVDALCLSVNQAKDKTNIKTILLCQIPVLLSSPIGIIIGMSISDSDEITEGVLMALASGIILYVSTADIIAEEFENECNMKKKLLCFLFGIGFIAVFLQFYDDEYEHHGGDEH